MWAFMPIFIFVTLLALLLLAFLLKGNVATDRLYMVYYEDGLWDLYLAAILLLLGVAEWIETPLIGIIPAILYPLLLATKQSITAPRLRPEELPPTQATQRRTLLFMVLGLLFLCGLLLFALGSVIAATAASIGLSGWVDRYLPLALWWLMIALFALWGYQSGERRLIGYAALCLVALLVSIWIDLPIYVYALVLGVFMGVIGLTVTVRFVHEHPKLTPG